MNDGLIDTEEQRIYMVLMGSTAATGLGLALVGACLRRILDKRRNNVHDR